MVDFIHVIKKDPQEQIKINDMLDRYNRLPYNYQSKIGYDTLIQNVTLKRNDKLNGYYNSRYTYRIKNEN